MRRFGLWVGWFPFVVVAFACMREEDRVTIDAAELSAEVARRADAAVNRPLVDQQLDMLIDRALDDKTLSANGDVLLDKLGAAPELAASFQAWDDEIDKLAQMDALVKELMTWNPGASPDRIGELAGQRVEAVTDGPAFDPAFERACDRLLARPAVNAAFEELGRKFSANAQWGATLRAIFMSRAKDLKFRRRLVELNGGKAPDQRRATILLADKAFSTERLERFYMEFFAMPVVSQELRRFLVELSQSPAFERHGRVAVAALFSDSRFRQDLAKAFGALLEHDQSVDELAAVMGTGLDTPHVEQVTAAFLRDLMGDEELQGVGDRAVGRIATDAAVNESLTKLADGW